MNKDEEVKKEIKDAAKRVFVMEDLNKTTMEDIAQRSRKKKAFVYFFKSKEEIFFLEIPQLDKLNNILMKAKAAIEGINSPKDKLKLTPTLP